MDLNQYQEKAMSTCMESCRNISYMTLGLVGEVGEFTSKIAKAIRRGEVTIGKPMTAIPDSDLYLTSKGAEMSEEFETALKAELGDCAWFLAGVADVMGWDLEDVCRRNIEKLAARKRNGTIDGSGDGITAEERKH